MAFQKLDEWMETAQGLHRGALLLGAVQRLSQPPQPVYLELGLRVHRDGLYGGVMPSGGRLRLDFAKGKIVYKPLSSGETDFRLDGCSQAEVFADLFGLLSGGELAGTLPQDGSLFERMAAGVTAKGGRYRPPKPETFLDEKKIRINLQAAGEYFDSLQDVFTGISRFRAQLSGVMSPLVVWPEHFDLSTLWFKGSDLDDYQPHLSFGFAPYSEGISNPYLYAYAYPYPQEYKPPALPEGAYWHNQGWTGVVIPYDAIADQPDPVGYLEASCEIMYNGLLALIS